MRTGNEKFKELKGKQIKTIEVEAFDDYDLLAFQPKHCIVSVEFDSGDALIDFDIDEDLDIVWPPQFDNYKFDGDDEITLGEDEVVSIIGEDNYRLIIRMTDNLKEWYEILYDANATDDRNEEIGKLADNNEAGKYLKIKV